MYTFKYLLTILLITALVTPNITLALEGSLGGEADGSEYGGGTDGGTDTSGGDTSSGGDPGYSGDGTDNSPSENGPGPGMGGADAEATSQAAADAQAASSYGMTGDVDVNATAQGRMDGTIDGDQVAMTDGSVASLSAGAAAADAISAANTIGGYVDNAATHAAYQDNPDMVPGTVVGSLTGTVGYPAAVARAEIDAAVTKSTVDAIAAINNSAATAYAATAKDLAGAISLATNPAAAMSKMDDDRLSAIQDYRSTITDANAVSVNAYQQGLAQTSYSGPKGVPSQGLNTAAQNAYSNIGKFSYDPSATINHTVTGGWVDQNGRVAGVDSFSPSINKNIDAITQGVVDNMNKGNFSVSIDTKDNTLSVTNLDTGSKQTASLNNLANDVAQNTTTQVGQQFGKTYSGPKGVPALGLNTAAQYAAVVKSNQMPSPVQTSNAVNDAKAMVAVAMAEAASLGKAAVSITMETITNRAVVKNTDITSVVTAPGQYQPVMETAKALCNCSKPTDAQYNQALSSMISKVENTKAFQDNLAAANSLIAGTFVRDAVTDTKLGLVDFANVPLTEKQALAGISSQKSLNAVVGMKADTNSITITTNKKGLEQTYGIRAGNKAPDFTPQTPSFDPNSLSTNKTPTDTYSPTNNDTSPNTTQNNTDTNSDNNTNPSKNDDKTFSTIGSVLGGVIGGPVGSIVGGLLGDFLGKQHWSPGGPYTTGDGNNHNYMRLCPPYPISCQGGAAILALPSLASVSSWFDGLWSNDEVATENQEILNNIVPVLITVNHKTGEIEINRPDIIATLEEPSKYYTTEQWNTLEKLLNETAIMFGDDGNVVYSNGLYSPPVQYGERVGQNVPEYVYTVEYIDENGEVINIEDGDTALPDNAATNLVRSILGSTAPFSISDVTSVTYRVVDPKTEVLGDEYYDYVITLTGDDVRGITIPQFTSTAYMQKRFEQLGFKGRATDLISIATETTEIPEQGLLSRLFSLVSGTVSQFTNVNTPEGSTTNLPQLSDDLTAADIEKVFIYPVTDITCPADVAGYETGFMYTAVIKNHVSPDYVTMVSDGRCGYGDPNQLVTEVAHHLETAYGINDVTHDSIVDRSLFINEPTAFQQIITNVYRPSTTEPTVEVPTEPVIEAPATTTPEQKPNLTNDVTLEVKAVGGDGKILLDWSTASSINISSGVSLYFRWDGSDYQQCLPFLQDGGSYALTRRDRAMLKGDTEGEGFNVPERTATYRVECGGQRNNEFGVDERTVEVTLE